MSEKLQTFYQSQKYKLYEAGWEEKIECILKKHKKTHLKGSNWGSGEGACLNGKLNTLYLHSFLAAAIDISVSREYRIKSGFILCSRPFSVPYVGGGGSAVSDTSASKT